MNEQLPPFAESSELPVFELRHPSLAAAVPTAMVLVDYALGDQATPTADIHGVAAQLPDALVRATQPIRAALAHGTSLREVALAQLSPDHPGHSAWPALRDWLLSLTDEGVLGLIEYGIQANLAWHDSSVLLPSPHAALTPRMGSSELRRRAAQVLRDWAISDSDAGAIDLVERPAMMRDRLVELLDEIWHRWLRDVWGRLLVRVEDTTPRPVTGLSGAQWLAAVTGLRPDARYAAAADRAQRLVVMACPGLGQLLTMFEVDETTFALYSPSDAPKSDAPNRTATEAAALTDLETLGPVLRALGDPTRLSIVLQLIASGPLTMTALTELTGVHQTTVSRQIAALRAARLAEVDDRRRVVLTTSAIENACHILLTAIHRPATAMETPNPLKNPTTEEN